MTLYKKRYHFAGGLYRFIFSRGNIRIGKRLRLDHYPTIKCKDGGSIFLDDSLALAGGNGMNLAGVPGRCTIVACGADARIQIGKNCGFSGASIFATENISIGNYVRLGLGARIYDNDFHPVDILERRRGRHGVSHKAVFIDDDVWIGAMVIVLKGVSIGKGSIIGAGSVVTKSVPPGVVCAGNPARVIRVLQ